MKALVFSGVEDVQLTTVPDPAIEHQTDVILQIELIGICGSDLHPYHGREKGLDPGTIMGHEAVGTVIEMGKDVRHLRKGDRVFGPFTTNCGKCFYCLRSLTCRCERGQLYGWMEEGRGLQGLQAEFARIPWADSTLVGLPENVTPEEGLLLGDVFSTGYFAAESAGIDRDGVFVILGCGPVGLSAILSAKLMGAETIFAVDAIRERLEMAARFGAIPIDFSKDDVRAIVNEATDGRGADGVVEVVGNSSAEQLAMGLIRPGGVLSTAGVHTDDRFSFSPVQAYAKNLTYKTGRCPARYYMDKLLPLVLDRKVSLEPLITHRFRLSEGRRAYQLFDQKKDGCIKPVLIPHG
jgi:threonine dehydrogenase-like Zn-dependent dehydrogenase